MADGTAERPSAADPGAIAHSPRRDRGRNAIRIGDSTMRHITFKNRSIDMAGNLYLPPDFDENGSYPAIVVVHPGGGVKEQAAGLYAERLAGEGFVTLAFDSSYQGESGGSPHFLDLPMNRTDDVYSAIDYVTTL